MSGYTTETTNAQFINQAFLNKIDQGMVKEASDAMTLFVRQKLREDGFTRKVLTPVSITAAQLDRDLTEEPRVIVEKEPNSVAATLPFLARPEVRYWKTDRYSVSFNKISSQEFKKSKTELMTYRTDIRTIIQENSVKDLQEQEDKSFYNNILSVATANSNVHTMAGGFTKANLMAGLKFMFANKLPVGCILMTQSMYADLMAFPSTDIGSPAASDLFRGQAQLDNFFGYKIITTNKQDILPSNQALVFAPQEYLGQFFSLQEPTCFLKQEVDVLQFQLYEVIGAGIGNVNGAVVLNF